MKTLTTGMDVVDLSRRGIARISSDGMNEERLHVLRVDANVGSRLIGPERGSRQVVAVDDPFHLEVLFQSQGHAASSRVQIHLWRENGGRENTSEA